MSEKWMLKVHLKDSAKPLEVTFPSEEEMYEEISRGLNPLGLMVKGTGFLIFVPMDRIAGLYGEPVPVTEGDEK